MLFAQTLPVWLSTIASVIAAICLWLFLWPPPDKGWLGIMLVLTFAPLTSLTMRRLTAPLARRSLRKADRITLGPQRPEELYVGVAYSDGIWTVGRDPSWDRGYLTIGPCLLTFYGQGTSFRLPLCQISNLRVAKAASIDFIAPRLYVTWSSPDGPQVLSIEHRGATMRQSVDGLFLLHDRLAAAIDLAPAGIQSMSPPVQLTLEMPGADQIYASDQVCAGGLALIFFAISTLVLTHTSGALGGIVSAVAAGSVYMSLLRKRIGARRVEDQPSNFTPRPVDEILDYVGTAWLAVPTGSYTRVTCESEAFGFAATFEAMAGHGLFGCYGIIDDCYVRLPDSNAEVCLDWVTSHRCVLTIDAHAEAVIDLCERRCYCRSGLPEPNPRWNDAGKEWDEIDAIRYPANPSAATVCLPTLFDAEVIAEFEPMVVDGKRKARGLLYRVGVRAGAEAEAVILAMEAARLELQRESILKSVPCNLTVHGVGPMQEADRQSRHTHMWIPA